MLPRHEIFIKIKRFSATRRAIHEWRSKSGRVDRVSLVEIVFPDFANGICCVEPYSVCVLNSAGKGIQADVFQQIFA
jgi:hypothetical protein